VLVAIQTLNSLIQPPTQFNFAAPPKLDIYKGEKAPQTLKVKNGNLQSRISILYNQRELSDITLICEAKKFHCHKLVLSVGSPVFKQMFDTNMKEKTDREVAIDWADAYTLDVMLQWMYGIEICSHLSNFEWTMLLYQLAHRFLLDALIEDLTDILVQAVTVDGAFALFKFGHLYNQDRFKVKGTYVMQRHRRTLLADKEFFHECYKTYPDLLQDIATAD